ncbi:MAG: gamma carbonic anhydrase family protein, partial [Pseudomonadota bacterium]
MGIYSFGDYTPQLPESGDYWVAESAAIIGNVELKAGANIWYNCVLRGDHSAVISVGEGSNLQDGTVCHIDEGCPLTIGAGVTVGHMAMLHGCTISDHSLIGIGATVLNRAHIGSNVIIGAHALIPEGKVIPDNSLVMGAPGKVVKEVSDMQAQVIKMSALHYVENARKHRDLVRRV